MINTFIAAIVALFFWGKSSKDIEEKTQLASWLRTLVYGVLTFLVSVFYVKTYQVATVCHSIDLMGIRTSINSNGDVADTIATIDLTNKFSSHITEDYFTRKTALKNERLAMKSEAGGLFIALNLHSGSEYESKNNPAFEVLACGGHPLEFYKHVYQLNYITSSIPSLVPLFPTIKIEKENEIDENGLYGSVLVTDCDSYKDNITSHLKVEGVDGDSLQIDDQELLREMYCGFYVLGDTLNTPNFHYRFSYENNFSQKLNFFTAADISQYTCDIDIKSDCYVKRMEICYDLPIEINPHDSCMRVSSYSFIVKGDFLNEDIVNDGNHRFHVKFPTLANLQLIRSLILTTLLTALVSLFFCNLFYLVRKKILSFKEKHISQINEEKAKRFRIKICVLALVFMLFIVYVACRIFVDHPFHINLQTYDWVYYYIDWIVAGIIILLCLLFYFMFRKAYTIKK